METLENSQVNPLPQTINNNYSDSTTHKTSKRNIIIIILIFVIILLTITAILYLNKSQILPNLQERHTVQANDPRLTNIPKIQNQANKTNFQNYLQIVDDKNLPQNNQSDKNEIYGIFTGFGQNSIQIVNSGGYSTYNLEKNVTVFTYKPATQSANKDVVTLVATPINNSDFFNTSSFGKIIQLLLTSAATQTVKSINLIK